VKVEVVVEDADVDGGSMIVEAARPARRGRKALVSDVTA
jgi:hypothetical protein